VRSLESTELRCDSGTVIGDLQGALVARTKTSKKWDLALWVVPAVSPDQHVHAGGVAEDALACTNALSRREARRLPAAAARGTAPSEAPSAASASGAAAHSSPQPSKPTTVEPAASAPGAQASRQERQPLHPPASYKSASCAAAAPGSAASVGAAVGATVSVDGRPVLKHTSSQVLPTATSSSAARATAARSAARSAATATAGAGTALPSAAGQGPAAAEGKAAVKELPQVRKREREDKPTAGELALAAAPAAAGRTQAATATAACCLLQCWHAVPASWSITGVNGITYNSTWTSRGAQAVTPQQQQ
jgi:hypothetical protein